MWRGVVARFENLKADEGLRQADLAAALGVSRPQIHEWLSDPRHMTLKAAGRLLLAMGAQADIEVLADPVAPDVPTKNKAHGKRLLRLESMHGASRLGFSGDATPKPDG